MSPSNHEDGSGPEVAILADPEALAVSAAERVAAALRTAVAERGIAHLALCGGSSPVGLYRELATGRGAAPWAAVHLWWVDDRFVPADHPDSNVDLVRSTLLEADDEKMHGAAVPVANQHPFPIGEAIQQGRDAEWVAREAIEEIERHVPLADGRPVFDVMILGVGSDGHIMSIFPGSPALSPEAPIVVPVPAPSHVGPHLPRITLRASTAGDARLLLVIVPDGAKAPVVAQILESTARPAELPARVAVRGGAVWLLTREAARDLRTP